MAIKTTNWNTNFILLAMLVALSILSHKLTTEKEIDDHVATLTSLTPEHVSNIQINKKNSRTTIKKQNSEWGITFPIKIKANQFRISSLLRLLSTNNYIKYPIDDLELSQYGFSSSSLNIQIDDIIITFGGKNPINAKRYILIDNNMYLIEDIFYPLINSQLGTLVDHKLFSDNLVITEIQTTSFILSIDDNKLWQSTDNATSDNIIKTVNYWKNAQSFGVHNYVQRKALDVIKITVSHNTTPILLLITDKDPWLIIARPELGLEYHFDQSNIKNLLSTEHDDVVTENGV